MAHSQGTRRGRRRGRGQAAPMTAEQLRAYADDHLAYEVDMLFYATFSRRVELLSDDPPLLRFFRNAAVEAFATHLRGLVGFLFPDEYRPQRDDVTARQYVRATGGQPGWEDQRGPLSPTLRSAKDRADKEVSHLTNRRLPSTSPGKEWPMEALANELRELLLKFIATAEPERLGGGLAASVPPEPFPVPP
jgi:hypothetical protein